MAERTNVHGLKLLLALLITIFVFVNIFLLAYSISFLKYQNVAETESDIKYELLTLNIQKEFLNTCNEKVLNSISSELDKLGSIIAILEDRFGKDDEKVLQQKKLYSLIEIQHFLNIKEYSKICNKNIDILFFFYSNEKPYQDEATRIGRILDNLKSERKGSLMIYSFDYDLDLEMIDILKETYNVSSPNSILINEEIVLEEISSKNQLEKYLK